MKKREIIGWLHISCFIVSLGIRLAVDSTLLTCIVVLLGISFLILRDLYYDSDGFKPNKPERENQNQNKYTYDFCREEFEERKRQQKKQNPNKYTYDSCRDEFEERKRQQKYQASQTKNLSNRLKSYVYCLAVVVKADGVVTDEEKSRVKDFITANFGKDYDVNAIYECFSFFIEKKNVVSPKIGKNFINDTSYAERYAFAEMLFSIVMMAEPDKPFVGIPGNVASVLYKYMCLFMLEEKDMNYLASKYRLEVPKEEEEGAKQTDNSRNNKSNNKAKSKEEYTLETYAYCFAVVVKADGIVTNEERRRVGEYLTDNFENSSTAIAHFNRLINGRMAPSIAIPKEFVGNTLYQERYALMENLISIALVNSGTNDNKGINNNVVSVLLKLMKLFELEARDVEYLCNKYRIKDPKQKKKDSKESPNFKNRNQRAQSNGYSQQRKQHSQDNSQQQQQQKESAAERRQKNLEHAFAVMGVPATATQDEIRRAYKSLALKYHPDTVQDEFLKQQLTEKFKEINWAYNLLKQ